MSLKSEILETLKERGVADVRVDEDAELHGEDVVRIDVTMDEGMDPDSHVFTFARRNNMTSEQMVGVMCTYIPIPETGMTEDEMLAAVVDGRLSARKLGMSKREAVKVWEERTTADELLPATEIITSPDE